MQTISLALGLLGCRPTAVDVSAVFQPAMRKISVGSEVDLDFWDLSSLRCASDSPLCRAMVLDVRCTWISLSPRSFPYDLILGRGSYPAELSRMPRSILLQALFASDAAQVIGQRFDAQMANLLLRLIRKRLPNSSHGCRCRACCSGGRCTSDREPHTLIPQFCLAHSSEIASPRVYDSDELSLSISACRCPSTSSPV